VPLLSRAYLLTSPICINARIPVISSALTERRRNTRRIFVFTDTRKFRRTDPSLPIHYHSDSEGKKIAGWILGPGRSMTRFPLTAHSARVPVDTEQWRHLFRDREQQEKNNSSVQI
jgi:hypothetical protein